MKKLLLLFCLAIFCGTASGKEKGFGYGLKGGANISSMSVTTSSYYGVPYSRSLDTDSKLGLTGGVFLDYISRIGLGISAELLFSQEGCKSTVGYGASHTRIIENTYYINIPIMIAYYIDNSVFGLKAGLQPGLLMDAKAKNERAGSSISGNIKDEYKDFDLSVPFGMSLLFNSGVTFDVRYNIGISNVSDVKNVTAKNNYFSFMLGFRF